jgi:hypothetical protein
MFNLNRSLRMEFYLTPPTKQTKQKTILKNYLTTKVDEGYKREDFTIEFLHKFPK